MPILKGANVACRIYGIAHVMFFLNMFPMLMTLMSHVVFLNGHVTMSNLRVKSPNRGGVWSGGWQQGGLIVGEGMDLGQIKLRH